MVDPTVIYDAEIETGCVVDFDNMRALGPVGGGPNAREELQAFIDAMPSQVFDLYGSALQAAYMEYWQHNFSARYAPFVEGDTTAVVERDGAGGDDARLAEREAIAAAGAPPGEQPADTDVEADKGAATAIDHKPHAPDAAARAADEELPPIEGECFVCHGVGTVPGATDGELATCNLCHGTGRITARASA